MTNNTNTIKAGYRLTVISWENDGDHYNTVTKDGLDGIETGYLVKLLSMLKKGHYSGGFGNLYDPDDEQLLKFGQAIEELGSNLTEWLTFNEGYETLEDLAYAFTEVICDYTGSSENYHTRMVESIKVEFIPEDITLLNVTEQFIK
jgi:hypothetical protein